MTAGVVFHNVKETTTMLLEQHIEELRLELREAIDPVERREIEIELELARAELAVITAEQEGAIDTEPPF
ncbi:MULTISPECIES: hypothetical protein [Rhizobium]|uniref:Uncharacterized protein n=2 Tax=Rhizobium/Agrobacterium group TaxID=227290 RepID=A0ABX6PQX9_9HYPH|nr:MULTISPECIES: hypothetical protein [Rhizobium]NKL24141.1 hypothetical protein [Rhizobium leguminosarum bv. viciae]NEI66245.1 hypothetical protein [Rhizobium leguminosarum]NKL38877.1 hypothetical protein [Rhizobium leguminosarum bv. viciae]NKL57762.1 hypothetical protein [Rhizobium leguminosarum bv. viciae]QKK21028.1 hypothetical protein FFM53_033295 [Rhizobium indicum]